MADLSSAFRQPFADQLWAFRLRAANLVPTERWTDLWHNQHDRAFVVAGAQKADLLANLAAAVEKSIAQGTTIEEFRRDFRTLVARHGWTGWTGEGSAKGEAWRMRVIYETNLRTSYAAGRRAQLVAGNYRYWVYRHSGAAHPRLHHLALDGIALSPDHPFWATHFPPNGWGCGCRVFGAHTEAGVRRQGGDLSKRLPDDWDRIDPKTGTHPDIDRGWDYAPGASTLDAARAGMAKIPKFPAEIGAAFGAALRDQTAGHWDHWLSDIRSGVRHEPGLVGVMPPGLITGPKAARHARKGNALSDADWAALPRALENPTAILLDEASGNLLFILPASDGSSQLAVAIDYWIKGRRMRRQSNLVVSAYRPPLDALRTRLRFGQVTLLRGEL